MTMLKKATALVYSFIVLFIMPSAAFAEIPKYGVYEISLTTSNTYTTPYTDVNLSATFSGPTQTVTIEGFWDGGNTWKIRMAPTELGTWTLTSVTSNDTQLNTQGVGKNFICHQPTSAEISQNEVLRNGFIKVNPNYPQTFMHADGTPFFFMGDTHWGGTSVLKNLFRDGTFQQMVDIRAQQGFTVFTATHLALHLSIGNEGGPPFLSSHPSNKLNPAFFQWVDKRIDYMTKKGIRPTLLIGAPDTGLTNDLVWLKSIQRYLVARYAAYDVVWFGVKEFQEIGSSAAIIANALGNTVESYDPYQHLTSIHPGGNQSSSTLGSPSWLDFHTLQRGGTLNGAPSQAGVKLVASDYAKYSKPVIQSEAFYEEPSTCFGPNRFTNPDVLLQGLWAIQLHGGWNSGYLLTASCDNNLTTYIAKMSNTSANYHTYLQQFFTNSTEYWKLIPQNNIVISGTAWAAAQLGKEYVLYLKSGGSVTVNLASASGALNVEWFNPRTGASSAATTTVGGSNQTFTAPQTTDWVLHISGGTAVNLKPTANFTVTPDGGETPLNITFDGSSSSDSDGNIERYDWDFGDGTTLLGSGASTQHTYTIFGFHTATLTVTDNDGATSNFQQTISATGPPVLDRLEISPTTITIGANLNYNFSYQSFDQYGNTFSSIATWSSDNGGTINPTTGIYVAGNLSGNFQITATSGEISAKANVSVDSILPSVNAVRLTNASLLEILFSEPLDTSSAASITNYSIMDDSNNLISVNDTSNSSTNATLGRVELTTGLHTAGVTYTVTVSGIKDVAGNLIADVSITYSFADSPLAVSNLTVQSGKSYELINLSLNNAVYIDRSYFYSSLPSDFNGLIAVRTANDDKAATSSNFLEFSINTPAVIYVAYDSRIFPKANWLDGWENTAQVIGSSDSAQLVLFRRYYEAGTIRLGGNNSSQNSMYTVAIKPVSGAEIEIGTGAGTGAGTGTDTGSGGTGTDTDSEDGGTANVNPTRFENAEAAGSFSPYLLILMLLGYHIRKLRPSLPSAT